jgi:hypothetical protein
MVCRRTERAWIGERLIGLAVVGSVFLGAGFFWLGAEELSDLDRLSNTLDGASSQSHLRIRMKALDMWSNAGWLKGAIGSGFGNFQIEGGALRAHMSFLTLLVERGAIGALLGYWIIFWLPVEFFLRFLKGVGDNFCNICGLLVSSQLFFAHLFYEVYRVPVLWVLVGLLAAMAWSSERQPGVSRA